MSSSDLSPFHVVENIESILSDKCGASRTRRIDGQYYYRLFDRWLPYTDVEPGQVSSDGDHILFVGAGSPERWSQLIDCGRGHRLYEPDPHRLDTICQSYRDQLDDRDWKLGTGLFFEQGFFDGIAELNCHPYVDKQISPLPERLLAVSNDNLSVDTWALLQVGALMYRDIVETWSDRLPPRTELLPVDLIQWSHEAIVRAIRSLSAEIVFSINLIDGMSEIAAESDTTYVTWEIDPATSPYEDVSDDGSDASRVYTYRAQNIPDLRQAGYQQVSYLPLAANPDHRYPIGRTSVPDEYCAEISFVGSSMKKNADRLIQNIRTWIRQQRADGVNRDWLEFQQSLNRWITEQPDWDEPTIETIQDRLESLGIPSVVTIEGSPVSIPMGVAEYRAFLKRVDVVRTIGDQFAIDVWGDSGWKDHAGKKGQYRGEADHDDELTQIYNGSKINLDVNRIYQPNIVTMRVFDVMATRSVVLTEASPALNKLFEPNQDCFSYDDENELLSTIDRLLSSPDQRQQVAKQAFDSLSAHHTIAERLKRISQESDFPHE